MNKNGLKYLNWLLLIDTIDVPPLPLYDYQWSYCVLNMCDVGVFVVVVVWVLLYQMIHCICLVVDADTKVTG